MNKYWSSEQALWVMNVRYSITLDVSQFAYAMGGLGRGLGVVFHGQKHHHVRMAMVMPHNYGNAAPLAQHQKLTNKA